MHRQAARIGMSIGEASGIIGRGAAPLRDGAGGSVLDLHKATLNLAATDADGEMAGLARTEAPPTELCEVRSLHSSAAATRERLANLGFQPGDLHAATCRTDRWVPTADQARSRRQAAVPTATGGTSA